MLSHLFGPNATRARRAYAPSSRGPGCGSKGHGPNVTLHDEPVVMPSGGEGAHWVSLGDGQVWGSSTRTKRDLPIVASPVHAGFPSPAEDYIEGSLDLNRHLVRHPAATFIVRVQGESMTGAGIYPGDLLVVDRSLEPRDGHVVIAVVDGDLTVKRLKGRPGQWHLVAEHPDFPTIPMPTGEDGDGETSAIWGVVTNAVRDLVA